MWPILVLFTSFLSQAQFQINVTAPRMMEASSVRVINQKKLSESGQKNILDILKNEAGLDVTREGLGGQSSVFIRGGESSHALVLIDGLEVNDPSDPTRRFNFNLLEISEIESIEIIKGARSVQYGSDAIAGVINIVTKKQLGLHQKKIKARQEVGSFTSSKSNLSYRSKYNEHFQIGLKGQHYQTKGYSVAKSLGSTDRDSFRRTRMSFDSDLNWMNHEITFLAELQKLTQDLDGGSGVDDPNANLKSLNSRWGVQYQSSWMEEKLIPKLDFTSSRYQRDFSDPKDNQNSFHLGDSTTRGVLSKTDYSIDYILAHKNKISFGGEVQQERMNIEAVDSNQSMGKSLNNSSGEFLLGEHKFEKWEIFWGARTDRGNYYKHQENYRGALNYYLNSYWLLATSYGTGFKAPTLYQYNAPIYGNPDVKPEYSRTYDVSSKLNLNSILEFESSLFFSDYKNLILFNSAKSSRNYENTQKAHIKGLENSLNFSFSPLLKFDLSYTYLEARDVTNQTQLPGRSRNKGAVEWLAQWNDKFKTNLSWSMIGKRKNSSSSNLVNPGYSIVSLNLAYEISKFWMMEGRLENLLNKDYVELAGYNTQKRSIFVSATYSFD
jgi:vitamin B12 transporter